MSVSTHDRARALAVAQDFGAEALDLNTRLVSANPADVASRTRLARCYFEAGRLDEAEAEYREVLRLDPRNRIATGGLENIDRKRHPQEVGAHEVRPRRAAASRASRVAPSRPSDSGPSAIAEPVPTIFAGLGSAEFRELHTCPRRDVHVRFAPRVLELLRRINVLQSSSEIAAIREPGKRQLFRLAQGEVQAHAGQWSVFSAGGREEARIEIGMSADAGGGWLRVGMGFVVVPHGSDATDPEVVDAARHHLQHFQNFLTSARRSLFLGWMVKEEGKIQVNSAGPRLDLREPSKAASFIVKLDPARTESLFFGKWLSAADPLDAAVLADPVALVRSVDRVLTGLMPLWRALWE